MEILGSIGHGLAVFFFWIFIIAIIIGLGLVIVGYLDLKHHKSIFDLDPKLSMQVGIGIFVVAGFLAYIFLGLADYKSAIKAKCNRVANFNSKEVKLETKIKELSDLRAQLTGKQQEVKRLQVEYESDIRSLTNEIRSEQKANHIQTFDQARQHPRISYDLSLIQRKKAYIAKLQETEVRLQQGTYELEFLERQAIDDLKMVKTLNNEAVEKLIGDINAIIAKYLPEAGELAVDVDPNSMQTPEQIWQQINSGN